MKTKILNKNNKQTSLKNKKKSIIEKIANLLKNKFNKLFHDKGYNYTKLIQDLNRIITDKDLINFDYNLAIIKIEKSILEIISNVDSIDYNGLPNMKKVNELLKKDLIINKMPETEIQSNNSEKVNCEWSIIAKNNYQIHLNEERDRKMKEEEKKKFMKNILDDQMKEKRERKLKAEIEEKEYMIYQNEKLKKMEEMDKIRQHELKIKYIEQQNAQVKLINDAKIKNENKLILEKINDNKYINSIVKDNEDEKNKLVLKKKDEREMYKRIIEENKEREYNKKLEKDKEKFEDKKLLDQYNKLLEKQEYERNQRNESIKKKVNNILDQQISSKHGDLKENNLDENFYDKFIKKEEDIKIKKERLKEDMKNVLAKQVIDKQNRIQQEKEIGKYELAVLKQNDVIYESEKINKKRLDREKAKLYIKDLDNQLNRKKSNKVESMNDYEKNLNREILNLK